MGSAIASLFAEIGVDTTKLQTGAKGALAAIYGVEGGMQKLVKAVNRDASGALQTFGVDLNALSNPLTAGAQLLKASQDEFLSWGDTVDATQRIIGGTTEETSKLLVVLGDFKISADTLKVAGKALKDEGLVPSLDTLKQLAVQYQKLPEGAARTAFGTKNLGKAYFDLSEILSKTPAEFDQLSIAAEKSGRIMGTDDVDAAQAMSLKMEQAQDKVKGLELAIGGLAVTTESKAITAAQDYAGIWQALAIKVQLATGMIDQDTASVQAAELAGLSHAAALQQVYAAELATTDASDRLTTATEGETAAQIAAYKASDEATLSYGALALAANAVIAKQKAGADAAILSAGLTGVLTISQDAYNATLSDTQPKIDELNKKLLALGASQGATATATTEAKYSTDELSLASQKAALAAEKYSTVTQGAKESTEAYNIRVLSLSIASQNAQETVDKMSGAMGSNTTYTIDNTAKIAALHAELDPLIASQQAAADAAHHAADEMVYQQLSAGLDADAAILLAEKMGLIDPASAAAAKAAQALKKQYDDGAISAGEYAQKGKDLADAINGLKDKNITVTTTYIEDYKRAERAAASGHEQGSGTQGGYATGTDGWMTVPGGYPNDSYRVGLSSGEQFQVTPAGQGGGGGDTFHIDARGASMSEAAIMAIVDRAWQAKMAQADARMRTR